MKSRLFSLAVFSLLLIMPAFLDAQAVGYGSAAVVYTSPVCHASDQASLVACVGGSNQALVVFDVPEIDIDSPPGGANAAVQIGSNKTLQGPVTLKSQGTTLEIRDSSNIVIQNITFQSTLANTSPNNCSILADPSVFPTITPSQVSQCGIGVNIIGNSQNIWIDHNAFSQCGEKCLEIFTLPNDYDPNGRYYVPDLITVSFNTFNSSYYGMAVSIDNNVTSSNFPEPGTYEHVTMYDNYFSVFRRAPRLNHVAHVHEFNNVILDWGGTQSCVGDSLGFGPSPETQSQLVAENNYFSAWSQSTACKPALVPYGGYFTTSGSLLLNGATLLADQPDPGGMFSVPYAYTLLSATDAYNQVIAQAGANAGKPSLVQAGALVAPGSGTISVTLPTASQAGNLLVATLTTNNPATFSGPSGWVQAAAITTSKQRAEVWYFPNNPGGVTSATFTSTGNFSTGEMTEWSGLSISSPLDVTGSTIKTASATSTVSTSAATMGSNDLAITNFAEYLNNPATTSFTPGSGWTNLVNNNSTTSYHATFDYMLGVSGTVTETETSNHSGAWAGLIVTFKP